jgi:hypothetical protein
MQVVGGEHLLCLDAIKILIDKGLVELKDPGGMFEAVRLVAPAHSKAKKST